MKIKTIHSFYEKWPYFKEKDVKGRYSNIFTGTEQRYPKRGLQGAEPPKVMPCERGTSLQIALFHRKREREKEWRSKSPSFRLYWPLRLGEKFFWKWLSFEKLTVVKELIKSDFLWKFKLFMTFIKIVLIQNRKVQKRNRCEHFSPLVVTLWWQQETGVTNKCWRRLNPVLLCHHAEVCFKWTSFLERMFFFQAKLKWRMKV